MEIYSSRKNIVLNGRPEFWIGLLLVAAVLFIYEPVRYYDFINLDDDVYVYANEQVRSGISATSVKWAFGLTDKQHTYWHPLTWLSHMLEVELYGVEPGRHHLTNVLLHIANSLLLFFALGRFTGALWQSALVAFLFAVHPVNVESVAWVAQRKNVLSTFLWLLVLLAYGRYAARPNPGRYMLVFATLALGLLAKPMLVTLPFVLLLLDYWPLKRFEFTRADDGDSDFDGRHRRPVFTKAGPLQIILEKIPLLAISLASVLLSSLSVKNLHTVISLDSVPLQLRITNWLVSYTGYIQKLFWPENLAVFYPYPEAVPTWKVVFAGLVLATVTVIAARRHKSQPYLLVGWLWFLGTLIPVSGIMQVGLWPAMADRWSYVPFIGIFVMMAWGTQSLIGDRFYHRFGLVIAAGSFLIMLTIAARAQVGYWRDSITLFEHELKVAGSTWIAHQNLAAALHERGRFADGDIHFRIAQKGPAGSPEGEYYQLALILTAMRKLDKAEACYREALRIKPDFVEAYRSLGRLLALKGETGDAVRQFQTAARLDPENRQLQGDLDSVMAFERQVTEAVSRMQAALAFGLTDPELSARLDKLTRSKKDLDLVLDRYQAFLAGLPGFTGLDDDRIDPVYLLKKEYEQKLPLLEAAAGELPDNAHARFHLACIYARKGQAQKAAAWLAESIRTGFSDWAQVRIDSDLTGIENLSGYNNFLNEYGAQ